MKQYFKNLLDVTESRWQLAGWLLLLAFPVTALVVNKAASTIFTLFAFAGLWLLITGKHERPERELRWVMFAFVAYFFVGLASYLLGEQGELGWKILGRDIRFLFAAAVAITWLCLRSPVRLVGDALIAGGLVTGVVALSEVLFADSSDYRASGETISILFGHLSAGLCLINLAFALSTHRMRNLWFFMAAIAALMAVLFSGTRGALLSVVLVAVIMLLYWCAKSLRRWAAALAVILVLLAATFVLPVGNHIEERISEAFRQVSVLRLESKQSANIDWPTSAGCHNSRGFLEWMIQKSRTVGQAPLTVDVSTSNTLANLPGFDCPSGFFMNIRHAGERGQARLYLPQRGVLAGSDNAQILVRGKGEVGLVDGTSRPRIRIEHDEWKQIDLGKPAVDNSRIVASVHPNETLELVPLLVLPGEYRFQPYSSSLGIRLLVWRAAWQVFLDAPIIGAGPGALPLKLEKMAAEGRTSWHLMRYDHAHSEILTIASERGILGLLSLFAVYAAPFWLFLRRRDVFGFAGMAFVASIFLSGLTETIFNHSLGITYYSMMVLILAIAPRADAGGMTENTQTSRKS